jgi:signal transduction histidine kinase
LSTLGELVTRLDAASVDVTTNILEAASILKRSHGKVLLIWDANDQHAGVVTYENLCDAMATCISETSTSHENPNDLAAWLSHEIRTPLSSIMGCATLLEAQLPSDNQAELIRIVRRSSNFLLSLVNDVLDICKISSGHVQIHPTIVSTAGTVYEAYQSMKVLARQKGLELRVEFKSKVPDEFETDPQRLHQILSNLLANAISYTDKGTIILQIAFQSDHVSSNLQFDIIDTGPGISREEIARLFTPFHQLRIKDRNRRGGTGLGLSICHHLAKLLGGEIKVNSQIETGSTFSLVLHPVRHGKLLSFGRNKPHSGADAVSRLFRGKRILVVDWNRDNCSVACKLLEIAGAESMAAENGHVALAKIDEAKLANRPFDAMVLDLQTPHPDLRSMTERLSSDSSSPPILALTTRPSTDEAANCFIAGCSNYLCKPISASVLYGGLAEILQIHDVEIVEDSDRQR